jgi:osmotically-inducible protein OsmY
MTEDENLQLRALKELEWDPKIDAARIGVAARSGVVTLTGQVPTYAEKIAAEDAVRRVKGVRAIAQEIEVHLPHEQRRSDTDIAERALRILDWDVFVPNSRITVEVSHGWVKLRGEVDWHYQRIAAEDAIRKLSGVRGITNTITVKPSTKAGDVRNRIEEAFKRHAELEARHVMVEATDGTVILSGWVENWREKELALNAAWNAPGVTSVEEKITLAP